MKPATKQVGAAIVGAAVLTALLIHLSPQIVDHIKEGSMTRVTNEELAWIEQAKVELEGLKARVKVLEETVYGGKLYRPPHEVGGAGKSVGGTGGYKPQGGSTLIRHGGTPTSR